MDTVETTQCLSRTLYLLVLFFNQSIEEMYTNNDLNLNNSHREDSVEFCPSSSIQQKFRKSSKVKQLKNVDELIKLQNNIKFE